MKSTGSGGRPDATEVATAPDPRSFLQQRLGIEFTPDSQRYAEDVLAHVEQRENELAVVAADAAPTG